MQLLEVRHLAGPNLHAAGPVLLAMLDLQQHDGVACTALPGFTDGLLAALPTLARHRCSPGHVGGFVERLRAGTHLAHTVEHVAIELQCLAGQMVGYGRARRVRGRPGHHRVVIGCQDAAVARAALELAVRTVAALAAGAPVAALLEAGMVQLRQQVRRSALGPSTQAVLDAARQRGIPVLRLAAQASLFQLGWGARQQRIQATLTGQTSHIAVGIASDKALTKQLLQAIGLPVPQGRTASTLQQAQDSAAELCAAGGAVAIKPLDGNQGKGVSTGVRGSAAVAAAFQRAQAHGRRVIVETHVEGDDHRVLVVAGAVVAAARRLPPEVLGDGRSSVRALVDQLNADPRRGDGHGSALTRVRLDEAAAEALARQGLDAEAVPAAGRSVRLRSNANLSTGGTAVDVTAALHPATARDCVRAAQRIGLDVAGIDLVCRDIGAPLAAQGGAIIEVNAAPGIRMHEHPSAGSRQQAGRAVVEALFGPAVHNDGRIPLVAVAGSRGKTPVCAAIAQVLQRGGRATGLACSGGLSVNGQRVAALDATGADAVHTLLAAPEVELAVLETGLHSLLQQGLGFDRCDVGVVLNVLPAPAAEREALAAEGIRTAEALAAAHGVVLATARRLAVLHADDPACVALAGRVRRRCETVWFGQDATSPVLARHLARGGRAVFRHQGLLVWAGGGHHQSLLEVASLPAALGADAGHRLANAMAALSVLLGLGLPPVQAAAGLATVVALPDVATAAPQPRGLPERAAPLPQPEPAGVGA